MGQSWYNIQVRRDPCRTEQIVTITGRSLLVLSLLEAATDLNVSKTTDAIGENCSAVLTLWINAVKIRRITW
jgi:hypothetical protein